MSFVFLQCDDEQCRFRFPAASSEAITARCPNCRGTVAMAAKSFGNKSEPDRPTADGRVLVALLDNIRSIHNVGSMFRSADGAGVAHLHLAGITATPEHPKLAKAALGAQESVAWSYHPNGVDAAYSLLDSGYQLWALERLTTLGQRAITPVGVPPPSRLALIVGNERAGIDPDILNLCDVIMELPMMGHKSSLNAAVAFGIAVYCLRFGNGLMTDILSSPKISVSRSRYGNNW